MPDLETDVNQREEEEADGGGGQSDAPGPPINSNAIAATQLPAATAIRKGAGDGARGEFIAPEA